MVYTQQSGVSPGGDLPRLVQRRRAGRPHAPERCRARQRIRLTPLEEFWVDSRRTARACRASWSSRRISRRTAKYPVLMLIHGGPQGCLGPQLDLSLERAGVRRRRIRGGDAESARLAPATGRSSSTRSTAIGAAEPFDDIMAVTDHVATGMPYADGSRMAAAGGSYGGYMIDWIAGPYAALQGSGLARWRLRPGAANSAPPKSCGFRCGRCGGTPWDKPENYAQWSPSHYAKDFHTPTLVIHGELDFRVPVYAGAAAFHGAADAEGSFEAAGLSR